MTSSPPSAAPPPVTIGAPGVDVERLVQSIRDTVARKMAEGAYSDGRIARAEKNNLVHLTDDADFFQFYLDCLRDISHVDINDYVIRERRQGIAGRCLIAFKTVIWKLLKFYTYRLWSQQNQINGLLLSAIEEIDRKYRDRIQKLEDRVRQLEAPDGRPTPL
jgi:hypothetical protein